MPGNRSAVLRKVVRSVAAPDVLAATDRALLLRFSRENDQAAFESLVNRHTGMVLGVCRRVLMTVQDAEDACQATFLLLASKASSGRWEESVANWLYTTARKVAHNARVAATRRAKREAGAAVPESVEPVDRMTGRELLAALDGALDGLPPRYREPLVLCYLEGLTRDEAATRLGVPLATLHTRIDRARKRLHEALTKVGYALGAGLLALAVSSPTGASPSRLVKSILATASGSAPGAVSELARGAAMNGTLKKIPLALAAMIGIVGLAIGLGSVGLTRAAGLPGATAAVNSSPTSVEAIDARPTPEEAEKSNEAPVSGRVLGVDGKPHAGAELLLVGKKATPKKLGVSGADGRFTVTAPRGERWVYIVARVDGAGVDFVDLGRLGRTAEVELRLVKDLAIRGRIVDTQGKPVAGASVQGKYIGAYANNSMDSFLTEWKTRDPHSGLPSGTKNISDDALIPRTTTDKDGRFTVSGIGGERLVGLRISGAGIAEEELWVVNRAGFDPKPYNRAMDDSLVLMGGFGMRWLLYGPEPAVVAQAEKPIRGVMKDKDTGKPRAGVTVTLSRYGKELAPIIVSGTTDAEGRYEIHGARKSKAYMVEVASDPVAGYMAAQFRSDDTAGYVPVDIDLAVKKGVIVTGRVIDGATGKPVPGFVMADALHKNAFVKGYPEYDSSAWFKSESTDPDGTFRIVTFPGPVILMGGPDTKRISDEFAWYRYKSITSDPKYPDYFATRSDLGRVYYGVDGGIRTMQGTFCKVLEIKADTATVEQDLVLEPATQLPVKIRGADDKPVTGAWVVGAGVEDWHRPVEVKVDTCAAYQLDGKPRLMIFHEPTKKLFGTLNLKGDEKEPVTAKLGAGGAVKGRLVGLDGKPLAGVLVRLYHRERAAEEIHMHVHRALLTETDAEGRFRIDYVLPGAAFNMTFRSGKRLFEPTAKLEDRTAEPGKTTDAGTLELKPRSETGGE